MTQLQYYNGSAWVTAVVGAQGAQGASGPSGLYLLATATQTGTTYTASAWNLVNANPSSAMVITLPTAPANGVLVGTQVLTSATAVVTFAAGGSDTLRQTNIVVHPGQTFVWLYNSSATTWEVLIDGTVTTSDVQTQVVMGSLI
jgi:hypothetical protein